MNHAEYHSALILKAALEESLEREWNALPPEEEIWKQHRFSAGFLRRMRRLTGQTAEKTAKRVRRRRRAIEIAAAGVVLALGLGMAGRGFFRTASKSADMARDENGVWEADENAFSQEIAYEEEPPLIQAYPDGEGMWVIEIANYSEEELVLGQLAAVYRITDGTEQMVYEAQAGAAETSRVLAKGETVRILWDPEKHGITEPGEYRLEFSAGEGSISVKLSQ